MNLEVDFRKQDRPYDLGRGGRRIPPRQRQHGKLGYRIGEVYFSGIRPLDTGGTPVDDLIWRRTEANKPPLPNKKMKEFIEGRFAPYFIKITHVVWSRYAGCSCPCSPGYIVYGELDYKAMEKMGIKWGSEWYFNPQHHEFNVWVSTPEYKLEQDRKQEERKKKEIAVKLQNVIDEGVYGI